MSKINRNSPLWRAVNKTLQPLVAALAVAGIVGEVKGSCLHIPTVADSDVNVTIHFEQTKGFGPLYNLEEPFVEVVNQRAPFLGGFATTFKGDRVRDYAAIIAYIQKLGKPGKDDL